MTRPAPDWTIRHVPETGSTNADLLALVDEGTAVDHLVLRTDHQTAGRGRLDRRWDAPPGANLLVSILFLDPPAQPQTLTQAVGVAAVRAIDRWSSGDAPAMAALKWPNDVLLDERKLAGVLAQRHLDGAVVVGIGLNVAWCPEGAVALSEFVDPAPSPSDVLSALLEELADLADDAGHFDQRHVTAAVRERLATIGRTVRIELPDGSSVEGRATGLEADGALVVEDASTGVARRFEVGDVVHLRPV